MRVIRPEEFGRRSRKRRGRKAILLLFVVLVGGFFVYQAVSSKDSEKAPKKDDKTQTQTKEESEAKASSTFKTFTGEEFKQLARATKYPNLRFFDEPPYITGNDAADERIRTIAESRGYVLTGIPINAIQKIHEKHLMGDDLLQPQAAIAWEKLKTLAQQDGIPLSMTSAYRAPAYQRDLFMQRLLAKGTSVAEIAAGGGEAAIIETLKKAALPGYSRHHTGYTIDLWCEDGSSQFLTSICFQWMNADNYQKPKEAGWIPSYPEGAGLQGPDPESWEYIWVGEENLIN